MSSEVSSPTRQTRPAPSAGAAAVPTWGVEQMPRWRENPQRLAWIIISLAFFTFMAMATAIPLAIRYTVHNATVAQEARLEPTLGTLLLYPSANAEEPIAVTTPRDDVVEGMRIVAGDDSTQGTLGLVGEDGADEILGSVQIYPGSRLDVLRIRRPYFDSSPNPYFVKLAVAAGQARIFTNSGDRRSLDVELVTPHGTVQLSPGSFKISVTEEQTEISVRSGQAHLVNSQGQELTAGNGLRAWMTADVVADQSGSAEQNLIRNGDFSGPFLDTWNHYVIAENVIPGSVKIIERDGRRVAHFIRQGEEGVNTEVGITQEIGKDVNVYDSLTIQFDVRLMHQSLPGAGYLSSEFPLRVEISYTDIYGKDLRWGHGFYFREPEDSNWRVTDGEKIPPFKWYTYQSPNLMELLADTRPARINSIRIYASGWNYQSMISEAYLLAE